MTPIRDYAIEPKPQTHYIIIHESLLDSVLKDAWTFIIIASLIGLGWWIGSIVMGCLGAFMALVFVFSRAMNKGDNWHTADNIDDAYRILDALDEDAQEGGL